MTDQFVDANKMVPITPPPELVEKWRKSGPADAAVNNAYEQHIATQSARWGADQELEACCAWLSVPCPSYGRELRNARRPKPPSLKEQALQALYRFDDTKGHDGLSPEAIADDFDLIRRALEALPE